MEDNLNLSGKGRLPQFFRQMEDDLNSWAMEYNLNLQAIEDKLNCLCKWKTTSICHANGRRPKVLWKMEDDLNLQENGGWPQFIRQIEDDLKCFSSSSPNQRKHNFLGKLVEDY